MTARPESRRPLALVPRSGDVATSSKRRAERLVGQWDPEPQLVGALLHLRASAVAPILNVVPESAIWLPDNRWAMEIIRHLTARNERPDPVTVLRTASDHGPVGAGFTSVSARRHHRFALHLADLYTQVVSPALVQQYARQVLEVAFRRAAGAYGVRLAHMAESGAPRGELAQSIAAMRAELAELWRRAEAARPAVGNP